MPLAKEETYYTYADYLEWDEGVRCEIIDGEALMMAPLSRMHQGISGELFFKIKSFLVGKPCKVYPAPFAVRLNPKEDNRDDTVLEPDITVICDPSKLDDRGCNGAPDLVVEILSPSTARHDRIVKFRKYQAAGVREYWIVDPDTKSVQVFILNDGQYIASTYDDTDTAPISVLPGCEIKLADVFAE
jgi:Uma2 family endonuclease